MALLLKLITAALHENDRSPYAKPKSREMLKAFRYLHTYKPQTHSANKGGRSRGKKGTPSLFENFPLKGRRHENTSELLGGALYFSTCPFSP